MKNKTISQKKKVKNEGVGLAITLAGSQAKLSKALNCTQSIISQWLNQHSLISIGQAININKLYKIDLNKLRPDVW